MVMVVYTCRFIVRQRNTSLTSTTSSVTSCHDHVRLTCIILERHDLFLFRPANLRRTIIYDSKTIKFSFKLETWQYCSFWKRKLGPDTIPSTSGFRLDISHCVFFSFVELCLLRSFVDFGRVKYVGAFWESRRPSWFQRGYLSVIPNETQNVPGQWWRTDQ